MRAPPVRRNATSGSESAPPSKPDNSVSAQARSAYTGVGFTTTEAESIVRHPVRRRIVMWLMFLGNVGAVTAISSLILTFVDAQGTTQWLLRLGILAAGGGFLLWASRSKWVDVRLSHLIDRALRRWSDVEVRDYAALLELSGGYRVTELAVRPEDWLAGQTLADLRLRDEGVQVLGIHHEAAESEGGVAEGAVPAGRASGATEPPDERPNGPSAGRD